MTARNLLRFIKCVLSQIHKLSVYADSSATWPFWHSSFPTPPPQPLLLFILLHIGIPVCVSSYSYMTFWEQEVTMSAEYSPLVVWVCGDGGTHLQFTMAQGKWCWGQSNSCCICKVVPLIYTRRTLSYITVAFIADLESLYKLYLILYYTNYFTDT